MLWALLSVRRSVNCSGFELYHLNFPEFPSFEKQTWGMSAYTLSSHKVPGMLLLPWQLRPTLALSPAPARPSPSASPSLAKSLCGSSINSASSSCKLPRTVRLEMLWDRWGSRFILVSSSLFWFLSTPNFLSQQPMWLTQRAPGSTLDTVANNAHRLLPQIPQVQKSFSLLFHSWWFWIFDAKYKHLYLVIQVFCHVYFFSFPRYLCRGRRLDLLKASFRNHGLNI